MGDDDCKYHVDHESRIKNLEVSLGKLQDARVNPGLWLGIFSFLGMCFSSIGNVIGQALNAYFKTI